MKKEIASLNLYFGLPLRAVEPLPAEFEGRHEVTDRFDLGIERH